MKIDLRLLKKQKKFLNEAAQLLKNHKNVNQIDGVLNLLDAIQDTLEDGIEAVFSTDDLKAMPKGKSEWAETHYNVVAFIENELSYPDSTITKKMEEAGRGRMWEMAEEWTDQFEQENKNEEWTDRDYFEELDKFFDKKLSQLHNAG